MNPGKKIDYIKAALRQYDSNLKMLEGKRDNQSLQQIKQLKEGKFALTNELGQMTQIQGGADTTLKRASEFFTNIQNRFQSAISPDETATVLRLMVNPEMGGYQQRMEIAKKSAEYHSRGMMREAEQLKSILSQLDLIIDRNRNEFNENQNRTLFPTMRDPNTGQTRKLSGTELRANFANPDFRRQLAAMYPQGVKSTDNPYVLRVADLLEKKYPEAATPRVAGGLVAPASPKRPPTLKIAKKNNVDVVGDVRTTVANILSSSDKKIARARKVYSSAVRKYPQNAEYQSVLKEIQPKQPKVESFEEKSSIFRSKLKNTSKTQV